MSIEPRPRWRKISSVGVWYQGNCPLRSRYWKINPFLQTSTQLSAERSYAAGEWVCQWSNSVTAERLGDMSFISMLESIWWKESWGRENPAWFSSHHRLYTGLIMFLPRFLERARIGFSGAARRQPELMQLAKTTTSPSFIGHVTKEPWRDPNVLEHMVDTVLTLKGNATIPLPYLESKNVLTDQWDWNLRCSQVAWLRFSIQVKCFWKNAWWTGSSIVATMEGTRPISGERRPGDANHVWSAKRTTTAWFQSFSLIMAVLEKRAGLLLKIRDACLKSAVFQIRMSLLLTWLSCSY